MNNIKTIVFDLYNTLIEIKKSNHFFLNLYRKSQDRFGMDASSYLQLVMKNDINTLKHILPNEFSYLYDETRDDLTNELESVIIYSEVIDVLQDLNQNFRVFLISNLASPYKEPVFSYNLDRYFEKMIFSCDYGYVKPDIEIFKEVETITNNKPSEILMIGDSFKSDIIGARKMKWNYLKINRAMPVSNDYEITDLREIKKHITKSD